MHKVLKPVKETRQNTDKSGEINERENKESMQRNEQPK
jgi:hypothetical protein